MKAILFSDIDGTLLRNKVISEEDLAAIRRFRAAGNIFMLCTGRMPPSALVFLGNHPQLECDGVVCAEGAGVCRIMKSPLNFEFLEQKTIDMQVSWDIITYIYENETNTALHWSNGLRCWSISGRFIHGTDGLSPEMITIDAWKKQNIGMNALVFAEMGESSHEITRILDDILARWGHHVEGYRNEHYLDITAKGINKGYGVVRAAHLFSPNSPYFGVGDGFNDIPMFEAIGKDHSFFISSGRPELKELANTSVFSVAECIRQIMGD